MLVGSGDPEKLTETLLEGGGAGLGAGLGVDGPELVVVLRGVGAGVGAAGVLTVPVSC